MVQYFEFFQNPVGLHRDQTREAVLVQGGQGLVNVTVGWALVHQQAAGQEPRVSLLEKASVAAKKFGTILSVERNLVLGVLKSHNKPFNCLFCLPPLAWGGECFKLSHSRSDKALSLVAYTVNGLLVPLDVLEKGTTKRGGLYLVGLGGRGDGVNHHECCFDL